MPCYRPVRAYSAPHGGVSFSPRTGYVDRELAIPCGQCIGCRLERSRQWAVRCMHEASLHDLNAFLTLTYEPSRLPPFGSLDRRAFPRFMKRLRKRFPGRELKYFHCGEYGELTRRPHYHALLFGFDFPDKRPYKTTDSGYQLFRSELLDELWPDGHTAIGSVTFETAAYTARYCTKKITGVQAAAHYGRLEPEFMTCSKGIGLRWIQRYASETARDDTVVVRGREMRPPRYYDKKLKELDPRAHRRNEIKRIAAGNSHGVIWNRTPERLAVREQVKQAELGETDRLRSL